jgi:hypothetical protein
MYGKTEVSCRHLYDLVLEATPGAVREREIVGIGADAKRGGVDGSGTDH